MRYTPLEKAPPLHCTVRCTSAPQLTLTHMREGRTREREKTKLQGCKQRTTCIIMSWCLFREENMWSAGHIGLGDTIENLEKCHSKQFSAHFGGHDAPSKLDY